MDGWNYFKVLSIVYGILLVLWVPLMGLFRRRWARSKIEPAHPEKQPVWVWPAGTLAILLILWTWYVHAKSPASYSWVVTLAVTITAVKLVQTLFHRARFRASIAWMIDGDRSRMTRSNLILAASGVLLIVMGLFVY